jgi:hypothetical protein
MTVLFVGGNRKSLIPYPKNDSWVRIEAHRGGFSQTSLEATRFLKYYRLNKFQIQGLERCLLAPARDA